MNKEIAYEYITITVQKNRLSKNDDCIRNDFDGGNWNCSTNLWDFRF